VTTVSRERQSSIAPDTRFLRNTWYPVLWSTDLVGDVMVARTVLNEPLVFIRDEDGKPSALIDICPHRFAPLHLGKRVARGGIRCGYHGLEYAPSGQCIANPHGDGRIPIGARVRVYPMIEKHRILWLWMGDGGAPAEQIPDFSIFDNPAAGTLTKFDTIELPANYELITDNLMDLSHTAFLHEDLLGNEDTMKAVPQVVQNGNTVTVSRTHPNIRPFKMWDLTYRDDKQPIDFWDSMRWDPPGCFLLDTFATRANHPRSEGAGFYAVHLLTPETETSTHYLFSGVRYNVENARLPTPELVAEIGDLRKHIFTSQDGMMIGAQQQVLQRFPDFTARPALFSIDAGPSRYKRVLRALIAAEGAHVS
jgi:phenylpropionate dioxygenase-like ring-hydroxylating dioxygenase large terminal subunit